MDLLQAYLHYLKKSYGKDCGKYKAQPTGWLLVTKVIMSFFLNKLADLLNQEFLELSLTQLSNNDQVKSEGKCLT